MSRVRSDAKIYLTIAAASYSSFGLAVVARKSYRALHVPFFDRIRSSGERSENI
jgi:hypothetical protein